MYKKIFISEDMVLNTGLKGSGRLANYDDLVEGVCMGEEPFQGIIEIESGLYLWTYNLDNKESVECVGEICEYIKICDVPTEIPIEKEINKFSRVIVDNLLIASLLTAVMLFPIFIQIFKI